MSYKIFDLSYVKSNRLNINKFYGHNNPKKANVTPDKFINDDTIKRSH